MPRYDGQVKITSKHSRIPSRTDNEIAKSSEASRLLKVEYHIEDQSPLNMEYFNRALIALKDTSINLSCYVTLILEIRRKDSISISTSGNKLLQLEINAATCNYL